MSGRYISKKDKEKVINRAGGRCEYCRSLMKNAIHTFHIDHITPIEKQGGSTLNNLALSCGGCNSAKSTATHGIDPITQNETRLFNPRIDKWDEYFSWSDDYLEMIGDSPIGRTTIALLRLNRPGLVNMRKLTKMIGEHPPKSNS